VIDFRYHLVSLVSVFLALAIGVVLGAGPLRESIGDTLTNQVDALRQDKENLQLAVGNRDEQIQRRDQFIEAVSPDLVGQQLGGRSVVIVALPTAGGDAVDALQRQVQAAGATVSGKVTIRDAWTDPDSEAFRKSIAGQFVSYLDPRPPAEVGTAGELAAVLAWAIATPDIAQADQADPNATTVIEGLRGGDLIAVDGDPTKRATLVLLATGAPDVPEGEKPAADASAPWLPLVTALDAASAGSVAAGPIEAAAPGGLVAAIRADEAAAGAVSTVDVADTPMGRVDAVLALREQLTGATGHYGFGDGATAVVPEIAQPAAQP
jgi:hypothetical protein